MCSVDEESIFLKHCEFNVKKVQCALSVLRKILQFGLEMTTIFKIIMGLVKYLEKHMNVDHNLRSIMLVYKQGVEETWKHLTISLPKFKFYFLEE